jgi:hypothetical protein
VIDLAGITYVLGDNLYNAHKAANQYDGAIQSLLTRAGVTNPAVAAALAQPDAHGVSAAPRLGRVFASIPYFNVPKKAALSDQRRLQFLNGLSAEQAAMLSRGLLNMPVGNNGQMSAHGQVNLAIAPPPSSMSPQDIVNYYDNAFRAYNAAHPSQPLPLPPDPGQMDPMPALVGTARPFSAKDYLGYYEMYTATVARTGSAAASNIWTHLYSTGWDDKPGGPVLGPQDLQGFLYYLAPSDIKGFEYYAAAAGIKLPGANP